MFFIELLYTQPLLLNIYVEIKFDRFITLFVGLQGLQLNTLFDHNGFKRKHQLEIESVGQHFKIGYLLLEFIFGARK